jgi:predicted Rossmann fold nucleotide-binding protein DprA/Smf involved in DNA uptake
VSGGAKGVDTWAESEARRLGMSTMIFPAKWHLLGKMAGYARNRDIVDAADEVVAFWDGRSRGTAHTAEIAERAGKPVRVYVDRLPPQVERVGL